MKPSIHLFFLKSLKSGLGLFLLVGCVQAFGQANDSTFKYTPGADSVRFKTPNPSGQAVPVAGKAQVAQDTVRITTDSGKTIKLAPIDSVKQKRVLRDSLRKARWPIPGRAARFSFLLPGLGQIYNHSYWKVPFAWAAVGIPFYYIVNNIQQYNLFRQAYKDRLSGNPNAPNPYPTYPDYVLKAARDQYKSWRDLSVALFLGGYALVALDAYVDAHLKHFQISDNLSLRVSPSVIQPSSFGGMAFGGTLLFSIR